MNRIIITTSIVLNAALLMVLFGPLPFFLYLSIIINAVLVWFSVKAIQKNNEIEEDVQSILEMTENFADHIEEVHSLEMYYGDQDLQNMLEHSRTLINDMISMQEKYFEVEVVSEEKEEEYDQEASTPPAETKE